ncbi:MAG: GNAT family N-acetyltransferase [Thermoplasmata archaeon]
MATLRPLSFDRETALTLARRAILSRNTPDAEIAPFLSAVERDVANGVAAGALRVDDRRVIGIALWEPPAELGVTVQVLYQVEERQTPADYRSFFEEVQGVAGPVVFAPGFLAGLAEAEENRVMQELGFARFARSEMRLPPETPTPNGAADPSAPVRATLPSDLAELARLHEAAYRGTFDRYLFLVHADPVKDADLAVREILSGRWGEFLAWASPVIVEGVHLRAAALVVRAPYGPLIADVMVDLASRGQGLGRAVLNRSVRALRERGETVIVLNVTEGNRRAIHLYESAGFVRSVGPGHGWYSTGRIPVAPETT